MLKPALKINFQSFPQSMSSAVSSGVTEALPTEKNPLRRERERRRYIQTEQTRQTGIIDERKEAKDERIKGEKEGRERNSEMLNIYQQASVRKKMVCGEGRNREKNNQSQICQTNGTFGDVEGTYRMLRLIGGGKERNSPGRREHNEERVLHLMTHNRPVTLNSKQFHSTMRPHSRGH